MMLKEEKSQYSLAIERMKVQLISYQKTETDLNAEINTILGRVIDG